MTAEIASSPWDALEEPSTRTPRSSETRDKSARKTVWAPSSMLPDPDPEDGYVFKWVRSETRNVTDKTNFQKRRREGWEPVRAEDHPEAVAGIGLEQATGLIEIGGLVLCKMPAEMVEQRNRYYADHARAVLDSAEQTALRDNDERMKKFAEKKRQVVYGR